MELIVLKVLNEMNGCKYVYSKMVNTLIEEKAKNLNIELNQHSINKIFAIVKKVFNTI